MKKTSLNTHLQMHLQSLINRMEWCHARRARFPAQILDQISLRCLLARRRPSFPVWQLPLQQNHPVWTKPRCCTKRSSKQLQASQPQVLVCSPTESTHNRTVQFRKLAPRPAQIQLQFTRRPRLLPASQRSLAASLIPKADSPTAWQTQQSTRSRSFRPRLRWILPICFPARTRLTSPHTLVCRRVCPGRLVGLNKLITNSNRTAAKYVSTQNIHHDTSRTLAMKNAIVNCNWII